jgi:hypothetical protein
MNPEIIELAELLQQDGPTPEPERPKPSHSYTLAEVHQVFHHWLGNKYDTDTLNAVLATAAAERLSGDPLWLLIVSGPGFTKTETVSSLIGAGAHITSTIQSEGALLSASPKRGRAKDATGGLLRKIGERGLLVIKDVTSILSANREVRGPVLAALREVYDGRWERNVGTDGGRTLTWTGRIVIIGAVTTAWDTAYTVIATMGDRFVLIRSDSEKGRLEAGFRAMKNVGHEIAMRTELADATGGLITAIDPEQVIELSNDQLNHILKAADITTRARTGVEFDYQGNVEFAHKPEAPTRFAKQLVQLVRGAVAIGLDQRAAINLAIRGARDSMPSLRLAILEDIAAQPGASPGDIRRRIDAPRRTVDRQCQALHMLHLVTCDEKKEFGQPDCGIDCAPEFHWMRSGLCKICQ